MSILNKINKKLHSKDKVLTNWDSRERCTFRYLDTELVTTVQSFIEQQDSYTTYSKCFLNHVFTTEIAICFQRNKNYIKCEFEILDLFKFSKLAKYSNFKDCIFYISNYENNSSIFNLENELFSVLYSNGNKVIEHSYIEDLALKYNNDLSKLAPSLSKGISINYSDLSHCKLPKDRYFFTNLADRDIHDVSFSEINFNEYETGICRFSSIKFSKYSVLSESVLAQGLSGCELPIIDFNLYNPERYSTWRFSDCIFVDGTVFPEYKNFFLECTIRSCFLPEFDFTNYEVNDKCFYNCHFTANSKLPKSIFTSQYIHILNNIKKIPNEHLDSYIKFGEIPSPKEFLSMYKDVLSHTSTFWVCKKYNLI